MIIKLFYKIDEFKRRIKEISHSKKIEEEKKISQSEMLKLVKRFEGTGLLKNRPRCGKPSLREECVAAIQSAMEDMATELSTGSRNDCDAGKGFRRA